MQISNKNLYKIIKDIKGFDIELIFDASEIVANKSLSLSFNNYKDLVLDFDVKATQQYKIIQYDNFTPPELVTGTENINITNLFLIDIESDIKYEFTQQQYQYVVDVLTNYITNNIF